MTTASLSGLLVPRLIEHASQASSSVLALRLRERGLTGAQWGVFRELKGAALTMTELADRTGSQSSNLTPVVQRMVRAGWLRRSRSSRDRRSVRVRLTKQGENERHAVAAHVRPTEDGLVRGLSEKEQRQLCRLLEKFTAGAMQFEAAG